MICWFKINDWTSLLHSSLGDLVEFKNTICSPCMWHIFWGQITPTSTQKFCKAGIGIPGIDKNRKIARGDKCICLIGKLTWLTVMTWGWGQTSPLPSQLLPQGCTCRLRNCLYIDSVPVLSKKWLNLHSFGKYSKEVNSAEGKDTSPKAGDPTHNSLNNVTKDYDSLQFEAFINWRLAKIRRRCNRYGKSEE